LAQIQFLPNISKYVMESSMVIGGLFLASVQFLLSDAKHAFATLTVFLAAGTRIAPAVMRVQQGLITLKGSVGAAGPSLKLVAELSDAELSKTSSDILKTDHLGFNPTLCIENVSYTYPGNEIPTLNNLNLNIREGEAVAIVGPSGAGKTTLANLLSKHYNARLILEEFAENPFLSKPWLFANPLFATHNNLCCFGSTSLGLKNLVFTPCGK
jgi:ABC-type multidrug transport system fused ATPase/permease subunit